MEGSKRFQTNEKMSSKKLASDWTKTRVEAEPTWFTKPHKIFEL